MDTDLAGQDLDTGFLYKKILGWYIKPERWKSKAAAFNPHRANRVIQPDPTRLARLAIQAKHKGELIALICDAYGMAISQLAQNSNISQSRMYEIVNGSRITEDESILLHNAIDLVN